LIITADKNRIFDIVKVKLLIVLVLYIFSVSCVGPPEQTDGLLENIPAVVNESDYFSLSILADDYTDSSSYDLNLSVSDSDILLTTLVLKDLDISTKDSTYFTVKDTDGDTVSSFLVQSNVTLYGEDSVSVIGVPNTIILDSKKFSGRLEYQILKK
tara:strand:- start:1158 stop:1625 length:468 start_codon:yes stop_codon:yes gene_type:complete